MTLPLTLIFACAEFGACPPPPPPPPAPVVYEAPVQAGLGAPAPTIYEGTTDDGTTFTFTFDDDGWVTYADGSVKCVNGAPCGATAGYDSSQYTYDWTTGVVHTGTVTQ